MKKQIWLRPDQHELVVDCLKFTRRQIIDGGVASAAHKVAGQFVMRRIDEILLQIEPKEETKWQPRPKPKAADRRTP